MGTQKDIEAEALANAVNEWLNSPEAEPALEGMKRRMKGNSESVLTIQRREVDPAMLYTPFTL